jgi:DNA-binding LytR/AlgR family response regulator
MNIAICDDTGSDAERLRGFLLVYFEQNGFAGGIQIFGSGEALLDVVSPGRFDVVFLDVYMGGITGVETAKRIRESDPNCLLVFVTVSDSHMRDGFGLRAASYLEKPLTPEKLEVALMQCRDLFLKNARYIEIKSGEKKLRIPYNRIIFVEVKGRSVFFNTDTKEVFEAHMKMADVKRQLDSPFFLCCHRSFIINMNYATDIRGNDIIMKGGQLIPIRINGRKEVVNAINEFLTGRLFGER